MRSLLVLAALSLSANAALAQLEFGWKISRQDVLVSIQPNSDLQITEHITADFNIDKHGIIRTIPIRYSVGLHQYSLRFDLQGVTDDAGRPHNYQTSYQDNSVRIKIGDPNRKVRGTQVYKLQYTIARAILHEGERQVLRWNAIGHDSGVPIATAGVTVKLPDDVPLTPSPSPPGGEGKGVRGVGHLAYIGYYGSKVSTLPTAEDDRHEIVVTAKNLLARQGITVEVSMPENSVQLPGFLRELGWWLEDNFVYSVAIITAVVCLGCWYWYGRDLPGRGTIMVQYEPPPGLGPTQVGILADERADMRDISAAFIDFAVRGFIQIRDDDGDYEFIKKSNPGDLKPYEKLLMNKLFGGKDSIHLSRLRNKFYDVLPKVKSEVYNDLAKQDYFDGNPDTVRTKFLLIGLLLSLGVTALLAWIQSLIIGTIFPAPIAITALLSAAIVVGTSRIIPRRTRKGRIAWEQIAGLEEYIRRAEAKEIAEQERRGIFERLLPYAIALGIADRMADAFEGIYAQPPDWFVLSGRRPFTTGYLVWAVDDSVNRMNSTLPSVPRSQGSSSGGWSSGGFSGGGFSGGGFGGGGTSSW